MALSVFPPLTHSRKAPSKSRSAVGLPQCYLPLGSTGETAGEKARVHHAARRRCGGVAASAIAGQAAAIMIGAAARLAMSDLVLRKFFMVRKTEVRNRQLARARAAGPPA